MELRQDRMRRGERLVAILKRQTIDRIPIIGMSRGFSALNVGHTLNDAYGEDVQKCLDAQIWTDEMYGWEGREQLSGAGRRMLSKEARMPTLEFDQALITTRYLVETEDEGWKLSLPSAKEVYAQAIEFGKLVLKRGTPYVSLNSFYTFTLAGRLCGPENLSRWMMKKPELAHRLLRVATDFAIETAQLYVDTFGPERFVPYFGEPTTANQIISPKHFEKFALPYIKDYFEKIQAMGVKHSLVHVCGEQNLNLPYWAQVHMGDPAIISIGHEVDLDVASKYFPNDIIMGNTNTTVMVNGTPQQVYENCRICIEKGRRHPGGFILAPGCELPPWAPPYNVWMMTKAVNDFGWYE